MLEINIADLFKAFHYNVSAVESCLITKIGNNPKYFDFEDCKNYLIGSVIVNDSGEIVQISIEHKDNVYFWNNQKYLKALQSHAKKNKYDFNYAGNGEKIKFITNEQEMLNILNKIYNDVH